MAGRVGRAAGARGGAGGARGGVGRALMECVPAAGRGRRRRGAVPAHRPVHDRRERDLHGDGLPRGPGVRLRRHQPVRPRRAGPVPVLGYRLDLSRQHQEEPAMTPRQSVSAPVREPGPPWNGRSCGPAPGGQRPAAGRRPVPLPRRAGGRRARPPGRHRVVHAGDGPAGGAAPGRPDAPRRPRGPGPGRPRRRPRLLERLRRGGPRPRGGAAGLTPGAVTRQLFLSAQGAGLDARGRPRPLHAAARPGVRRHHPVHQPAPAGPAGAVRPAGPGGPGHRPPRLDPGYLRRELPVVDLEPLPAEIAATIPGLAGQPTRSTS